MEETAKDVKVLHPALLELECSVVAALHILGVLPSDAFAEKHNNGAWFPIRHRRPFQLPT